MKEIKVIRSIQEMIQFNKDLHQTGGKLGLAPTMGYLHEGHLSLMRLLSGHCTVKAASIFVNPIQFGPGEDFDRYPRDEERDLELLSREGCEVVFSPTVAEMYPEDYQTYVNVNLMSKKLCGAFRPDHFRGVSTVVLRLFNIMGCDTAAFGLKDFQQTVVIRKMVEDLHLPVKLLFGETVREQDGLALSSRNSYLSAEERRAAVALPTALEWARQQAAEGMSDLREIKQGMEKILIGEPLLKIQYIEFVDPFTLEPVKVVARHVQAVLAVYAGKTRLIDNIVIGRGAESKQIQGVSV